MRDSPEPTWPAWLALTVLVGLVVASPWPFGSVHPVAVRAVSSIALATACVALLGGAREGGLALPALPLWPTLGLLGLGLLHCVPLPPPLHALLAPGPHAVWYPSDPTAAAVLGAQARPIAIDPASALRWLALTAGLIALAIVSVPALCHRRLTRRAAIVVVLGGLAVATYGIFARARFGSLLYGYIPVPSVSPFGPFVNKNHFAGYAVMTSLLALGLSAGLADRGRARESDGDWTGESGASVGAVLALVASLAMALAVLVSLSRGGLLSLLGGTLAFFALRWQLRRPSRARGRGRLVAPVVVGLLLGTLLVAVLPREAHDRMRSLAGARADSSGSFRLDTWRDTLVMVRDSPWVGHGMGSFHDAFARYKRGYGFERVEHAENDYLELLADGGVLGLALALLAAALLGARSWRGLGSPSDGLRDGIDLGALAGLTGLAVHSAVDFNLRIPSNALLAAFLAAAAAASAGLRPLRSSARGALVAAACALAMLVGVWLIPDPPRAVARRAVAGAATAVTPEAQRLRTTQAESALHAVLGQRPADAESWLLLAWTRGVQGDTAAAVALARYAVSLDPERNGLRTAAESLIREVEGARDSSR